MDKYEVVKTALWAIKEGERIVIEVTSEGYAFFLLELLNNRETENAVLSRPTPDTEYFEWELAKSKEKMAELCLDVKNGTSMSFVSVDELIFTSTATLIQKLVEITGLSTKHVITHMLEALIL